MYSIDYSQSVKRIADQRFAPNCITDSDPCRMIQSDTLQAALIRHAIELPQDQIDWLSWYCELLWDWNQKLNLTRHTDFERFVSRDLVDTLELSKLLAEGEEVLDVGSGGGVPGIPLAIIRPDLRVSLCDSVGKKAKVLEQITSDLDLPLPIYHGRVEAILPDFRYDALVARAVGPLWKILTWLESSWPSVGRLFAIKGPRWVEERGEARHRGCFNKLQLRRVASYPLVGTESESVILKIWPKGAPDR